MREEDYGYAASNPLTKFDPLGEDIWIEGPSGWEPGFHRSVNVGDPNGDYTGFSFALIPTVGNFPYTGSAYEDKSKGGQIVAYLKTTKQQDIEAFLLISEYIGKHGKGYYSPWNNCITFSNDLFDVLKNHFGVQETTPPTRIVAEAKHPVEKAYRAIKRKVNEFRDWANKRNEAEK